MSMLLMLIACGGPTGESPEPEPTEQPVVQNKERPEAPPFARVETYKISPEDPDGYLQEVKSYDDQGNVVEIVLYEFGGSGKVDKTVKISYDDQGREIRRDDGTMVTTTTWDDQGRKASSAWKRGEQGATTQYTYDEHGNELVLSYLDPSGAVEYTREYERTYDAGGRVTEEKKWEKSGGDPLLLFHFQRTWDDRGNLLREVKRTVKGDIRGDQRYEYDGAGNKILETRHDQDGKKNREVRRTFNEYGEVVEKTEATCGDDGNCPAHGTTTYTYDEYGNQTRYLIVQDHGSNFGERVVYTYRK